jgi:hypothetical protein
MSGDAVKASAAYQDFLTRWKGADPDIPILIAAKAEYATLNQFRGNPEYSVSRSVGPSEIGFVDGLGQPGPDRCREILFAPPISGCDGSREQW